MRWSWRLGQVAGIDVFVHSTFLFLLAWVVLAHYFLPGSRDDVVEHDCHTLPVLRRGGLVGLLTMDTVGESLRMQAALGRRQFVEDEGRAVR